MHIVRKLDTKIKIWRWRVIGRRSKEVVEARGATRISSSRAPLINSTSWEFCVIVSINFQRNHNLLDEVCPDNCIGCPKYISGDSIAMLIAADQAGPWDLLYSFLVCEITNFFAPFWGHRRLAFKKGFAPLVAGKSNQNLTMMRALAPGFEFAMFSLINRDEFRDAKEVNYLLITCSPRFWVLFPLPPGGLG